MMALTCTPPLCAKAEFPTKGCRRRSQVGDYFRNKGRRGFEARQGNLARAGKTAHFQLKIGYHGTQVGVPAAFPDAVDRALHLHGAVHDGCQAVGHGQLAVVVGVDARTAPERAFHFTVPDDGACFLRHRAAVGIAQDEAVRTVFMGGLKNAEGVFGVRLNPSKKCSASKKTSVK